MTQNAKNILAIIESSNNHLSAEEIFFKLKKQSPKIVMATVYNNLKKLVDENLIIKLSVENCPDRYDKLVRHDHLVCKKCGKIADINLADLTETLYKQVGDEMLSYDLRINYICKDCKKKLKK